MLRRAHTQFSPSVVESQTTHFSLSLNFFYLFILKEKIFKLSSCFLTNSQGIWSRLPKCIPLKASWELAVLTDDRRGTAAAAAAAFQAKWGDKNV